jgi:purine-nucleoside phosphorylase
MLFRPEQCAARLSKLSTLRPTLGIVLGSGFQSILPRVEAAAEVPYSKLPGFPAPCVPGHAGRLILGFLGGTTVVVLSGRAHYYEGHSMEAVTFPVRALAAFGIRDLLLTNAAGGINRRFKPGDFMRATDHLNFMGANPLRGPFSPDLERFVDLTETYSAKLGRLLDGAARRADARIHQGVYLAVSGPSYETPAEIRAFKRWGADAVGLSTVPEAIVARQCGLGVASLSLITNAAAGMSSGKLAHADVLARAIESGKQIERIIEGFAVNYGRNQ